MQAKIEKITPTKAKAWLTKNTINRPLRQRVVDRYAGAIHRGEWKVNGETIKLNGDGTLVDGQHRLHAVVQANMPIDSFVVRGVAEEAFDTIDRGEMRKLYDVLARHGEKNYTALSAAVRLAHIFDGKPSEVAYEYRQAKTCAQNLAWLAKNPKIRDSVALISGLAVHKIMPGSVAMALHYHFAKRDETLATLFWQAVATGENLKKSDSAYVLREKMIENRNAKSKLPHLDIAAVSVKAWQCLRSGKACKVLRWSTAEDFPTIN